MSKYHWVTFAWGHESVKFDIVIFPNWDEVLELCPLLYISIWTEPGILPLVASGHFNVCSAVLVLRSVELVEIKPVLFQFLDLYCPPIGALAIAPFEWCVIPWPLNQLGNATLLFVLLSHLVKFPLVHEFQYCNVSGFLEHKFLSLIHISEPTRPY